MFIAPATAPGSQSISGSEDACAFSQNARERLGEIIKNQRISRPGFSSTDRWLLPFSWANS